MIKSTIKSLSPQHIKSTVIGNTNVMVSSTVKEGGDVEIDPVFRNSVAYNITQQDVDYWNAGAGVDLSSYVTYDFLSSQAYVTASDLSQKSYVTTADLSQQSYVTASDLSQQSYLTAETDPVFSASVAANITQQDVDNWNAATGGVDLSAYVTKEQLVNQSYLQTEIDPVFTSSVAAGITQQDIENWNRGGSVDLSSYVTYDYLSAQSYLQTETEPAFNASPAATITTEDIQKWDSGSGIDLSSYVTKSELSAQSYLTTENDPVFSASPAASITDTDIANWNAAAGTIDMSAYVTKTDLVNQSYITINDVTFPDYSNTYQAKGNYLTSETDPIFSASPAATITTQDIQNWNAGGSVDLSSYVTKQELSAQAYLTSVTFPDYSNTYQSKGNYLTSETDPVFSASVAANITQQDVDNWNAATGGVDLSAYVTKEQLVNQSYITINDVTYPDYSNTYQAKGDYVTKAQMSAQSYIKITDVVFPDYSNTYQAKGNYVTTADLSQQSYLTSETDPVFSASPAANITTSDIQNWNRGGSIDLSSYVTYDYLSAQSYLTSVTFPDYSNTYQAKGEYITPTQLVNQSYITINDVVFPDYSSTYQTIGDYVTLNDLSAQSYVTKQELSSQSYITPAAIGEMGYTSVQIVTQAEYQDKQDGILYIISDADPIGGNVDLSSYVTYDYLSAQSYLTSVAFPDYSSTYQTIGDYVTLNDLSAQSYVTKQELSSQSYIKFNASNIIRISGDNISSYQILVDHKNTHLEGFNVTSQNHMSPESYIWGGDVSVLSSNSYCEAYIMAGILEPNYITPENSKWIKRGIIEVSAMEGSAIINAYADLIKLDGCSMTKYNGEYRYIATYNYVTNRLSTYVTKEELSAQSYLTSVTFPDYSNTYQTKGEYITPTQLVNQSYITINDVTYPDYSNTYQAKGEYITPTQLVNQSYIKITDVVFPDYSNTYQAKGDYVTKTQMSAQTYVTALELSNQSYITPATLSAQAYLTSVTFPDYSSTYQTIGDYVTKQQLSDQSYLTSVTFPDYSNTYQTKGEYITPTQLVNQSYITINDVTYPDYSNTYQAKGEYITPTQLVNQSYITINDVTYPDYSNTYQAKGEYITPAQLSAQSYINANYLTTNRYLMSSYPFTGATKLYTEGMDIYNGNVFPKRLTYAEVNSSTYYDSFVSIQTMKYYVSDFMNNVVGNIETLLSNI